MTEPLYTIRAAAKRTGLSPHVIRVWEKRFGAVKPERTATNRRLYSEEEVARLALLRKATLAGHSISQIYQLQPEELSRLSNAGQVQSENAAQSSAMIAVSNLDEPQLNALLEEQIVALGLHGVLERFIAPLAKTIGEAWRRGDITAGHEHFTSNIIRDFLHKNSKPFAWTPGMPTLIAATPSGQLHELGAVIVAAAATDYGWRVVYVGSSLPASEIASVAVQQNALAVALSIVYPEDDPGLPGELELLRQYLPPGKHILVGGRASHAYREVLQRIGATCEEDISKFYGHLDLIRKFPRDRAQVSNESSNSAAPTNAS